MSEIEVENYKKEISREEVVERNRNFYDFLEKHRVVGEGVEYTHTSYGKPFGKYYIGERMDYEKFLVIYKRILEAGVLEYGGLYMTEKQKKVGPLFVDYDFRFNEKSRQYSSKNIKDITEVYMNLILKYMDIKDIGELKAYVTEKEKPTYDDKKNNYKDGFHVVFPLPFDVTTRFLIHEEAKEIIKDSDILEDIPYINELDDVIDESVVMRNGWLMYGSKKPEKTPYMLTKIYDKDMNIISRSSFSKDELVVLFAARRHDEDESLELKDEFNNNEMKQHIQNIYNKYNGSKKQKTNIMRQEKIINYIQPHAYNVNENNKDVVIARKLVKLLSSTRATKYAEWASVGWALYNIDNGLCNEFLEFSRKCPAKYNEYECRKFWNNIHPGGYTIASLHFWAKQDNPEEYNELILEVYSKLLENAETGNHDDLAKLLFELYKHEFKCTSKTKNKWYAFYNNRWHFVDQAYTLANKISDEIATIFGKRCVAYLNKSLTETGTNKDVFRKNSADLFKIIDKLKTESFKNSVIASAASRFIDEKFEELLDSNCDLLGFENGVYDLRAGIFRKGIPEDYIYLSTGYNYDPNYNLDSKEVKDIIKYFREVMVDEDMRDYTLLSFASFLDGHIRQQVFRIFTGSGGNGKSQTMDLLKLTMGQYFGKLPTGVITRKRGSASSATPELADKRGKRFLVIDEPEHDDVMYVGQMKQYTGGDIIPARALYGDPFEYKPQFKMGLLCNKKPILPGVVDGGTLRRLKVVPFESEFVDKIDEKKERQFKKDSSLTEKMKTWGPAFMWYLVTVYYEKYKKANYEIKEPKKVTQYTDQYRVDSDKYYEFLSDNVVDTRDDADGVLLVSLYATFRNWHSEAGYGRNIPARNEFANYLITNKGYKIIMGEIVGICYKEDFEEKQKAKQKKNAKKGKGKDNISVKSNISKKSSKSKYIDESYDEDSDF